MPIGMRNAMLAVGAAPGPTPAYWGLCFTAEEPNVVVNMSETGSPPAVTLETSTDGVTWTAFDAASGTTPITLAAVGDKVYFRAGSGGNTGFASSARAYRKFTISGLCNSSGNIMSLLDGTDPTNVAFQAGFSFNGLFDGCTSLTAAPELPATTLAGNCYRMMFRGCTSLTAAPSLPATTLAQSCYSSMFSSCTSLTAAPSLPATTLAQSCYSLMFNSCTSLTAVEVDFAVFSPTSATTSWLSGVAATGTFRCPTALGTNTDILRGTSYCPTGGWTVINTDA